MLSARRRMRKDITRTETDEPGEGSARSNARPSKSAPKMKRKSYEKQLRKLQVELSHLQDWVKRQHLRVR